MDDRQQIQQHAAKAAEAKVYSLNNTYLTEVEKVEVEEWYQLPGQCLTLAFLVVALWSVQEPASWWQLIGIPISVNLIAGRINWFAYSRTVVSALSRTVLQNGVMWLFTLAAAGILVYNGSYLLATLGYRRITGLLRGEGWPVHHKRVERLWRREGLKVPQKQPKRGRLWLADGSCVRRRPEYRHHVWAYDFVADRTHDGRPLKLLTIVEEYSRECLAIVVARRLRSIHVLETLAALFVTHGVPAHIRSDNGPEFTAALIRLWLEALQVQTLFIEPGSPDLDREMAEAVQHGAAAQCAGLSTPNARGGHADTNWRVDHELSSLIRTGSTLGGRSLSPTSVRA